MRGRACWVAIALSATVVLGGCGGGGGIPGGDEQTRDLGGGMVGRSRGPIQVDSLPSNGAAGFLTVFGGTVTYLAYAGNQTLFNQAKIVFTSQRDGNNEVYVMSSDGSNQQRVTNDPANDTCPSITADGSMIVWVSDRSGSAEIYHQSLSAGVPVGLPTRVTTNSVAEGQPMVSPDGARIAYTATVSGNQDVYVMMLSGSNPVRLTSSGYTDAAPQFSPNSSKLSFISNRTGGIYRVFTMNVDGTAQTQMTNAATAEDWPTWSPDGSKLLFMRAAGGGVNEFWTVPAAGGAAVQVTTDGRPKAHPWYSPDGQKIAFVSSFGSTTNQVWVMSAGGVWNRQLTNFAGSSYFPRLSGVATNRTYIGAPGSDGGANPPFGASLASVVVAQVAGGVKEVVGLDATTQNSLSITPLYLGDGSQIAAANVNADAVTYVAVDNGRSLPPTVVVGAGGLFGSSYPNVEMFFDANTGRLTSVLPMTRSRSPGETGIEAQGDRLIVRGDFAGAIAADRRLNLAPTGAQAVVIDRVTGRILEVR